MRIGITGINGFIGFHLSNSLKLQDNIELIEFKRDFFDDTVKLDGFFSNTDIIVHLAGINRASNESLILNTNPMLAEKIAEAAIRTNFKGKIIYISSIQEDTKSVYGESKLLARKILAKTSTDQGFKFIALIAPNVFGPFCKPKYNSFIATFCDLLVNRKEPTIIDDEKVKLIYIDNLVKLIIEELKNTPKEKIYVKYDNEIKVSEVLNTLRGFQKVYLNNGEIPDLTNQFDTALFNTFRSYINYKKEFPIEYKNNTDSRGNFIEILRSNSKGQYSYSLTKPGVIRGNHFHTRKVERFAVISGNALIKLRKIDSDKVIEYKLSGDAPAFVDMPIWYTHSIKNIGKQNLITLFWINEPYNEKDSDTFFEKV